MAKLPVELNEKTWRLKRELLDLLQEASSVRFYLTEGRDESEAILRSLEEVEGVAEWAEDNFKRISTLQLRVTGIYPTIPADVLELLVTTVNRIEIKIPASEQSLLEVKRDWAL